MALLSLLLGIFSFLFALGGVVLVVVPYVGSLLSFGAPVLSLFGIVLGGVALSRAKQDSQPTGLALSGLIVSAVALLPALLFAMTCGVCNANCSQGATRLPSHPALWLDGGVAPQHPFNLPPTNPPSSPTAPAPHSAPGEADASLPSMGAPPPAFPPPPIESPSAANADESEAEAASEPASEPAP